MAYRLTLEGDGRRHLIYDPATSSLVEQDGDGAQIAHPAFATDGPVSWSVPRRVSPGNPGRKKDVRTLKIQMGFRCNYACAYCNQSSHSHFLGGATEDARRFLDTLDTWFRPGGGEDVRIEFWGGEPFVYWARLRLLGEALRGKFPDAHLNVITNGSLLDDEKADWLIENRVGVQISHDGPAQKHRHPEDILDDPEKRRVIRKLVRAGIAGFGTVLTRWNFSLAAARRHIEEKLELPPGTISHNTEEILLPFDAAALDCVPQGEAEHRAALHTLFREAANGESVPACNSARRKIEDFFASLGQRRPLAALGQKCGMDREDAIAVNLMGEVTTCHNTAADGRHRIGTVADLDGVRLTTAHHHQTRSECRCCPVVQLCKGSCMFLEGAYWQAACDVSFIYNTAMLAASLYYLTGLTLTRIEALDGGFIRRPGRTAAEVIRLAPGGAPS